MWLETISSKMAQTHWTQLIIQIWKYSVGIRIYTKHTINWLVSWNTQNLFNLINSLRILNLSTQNTSINVYIYLRKILLEPGTFPTLTKVNYCDSTTNILTQKNHSSVWLANHAPIKAARFFHTIANGSLEWKYEQKKTYPNA